MNIFKYLYRRITGRWWVIKKLPKGYSTYLPRKHKHLDTGLTKTEAQAICKELNNE